LVSFENPQSGETHTVSIHERRVKLGQGRRSLLQIKIEILKVVLAGNDKPTQVMYRANLSWNVLQAHLRELVESGLLMVENVGARKRYTITTKGIELIRAFEELERKISG
jgi:predicted transcriptional regulator